MTHYSLQAIETLIDKYNINGGMMTTIQEGSLGYGVTMLYGENLKTAIIKEVFKNPWSSTHTVRFYNEMPKKYEDAL